MYIQTTNMKTFTLKSLILGFLLFFLGGYSIGQTGILNPNDPIVVYNPSSPPSTPPANTLAKWVKTNRFTWNTSSFKCYYYNGIAFRLRFPNSYSTAPAGTKFPLYLFFAGIGERGTIYDNEFQLYHGGQKHMDAVNANKYDGFLLYPQTSSASGGWSTNQLDVIANLIQNFLIPQVNVDPFRISVNGLSGGGGATWSFMARYPKLAAGTLPMSAAAIQNINDVPNILFNQIWITNGGLDRAPSPYTVDQVLNAALNAGVNIRHTLYPTLGHGVWNTFWGEPDYFPFMMQAHKANPWPLFGRTEFCPGDNINVTIGVTAGFDGYEWKKNGVLINGASSNSIQATSVGVYECRIKRGTEWSVWSPKPVEIKYKGTTISPDIKVSGMNSNVIPSLDGRTSVDLEVPSGYTSYVWQKLNPTLSLPTSGNVHYGATPGVYQVKVSEQYGCSSNFSNPFTVIDANGPNSPSAPSNFVATTISKTEIRLNWLPEQFPANQETGFEVYQSLNQDGPFLYIGLAQERSDSFIVSHLNSNTRYYFKVRAINTTAGSPSTSVASALTLADNSKPTAPGNLRSGLISQTSIELIWDASNDDVEVSYYDIYQNGHLAFSISGEFSSYTIYNLVNGQYYIFTVKARDNSGNVSSPSNQLVAAAAFSGLNYKHYTYTGTWNNLPDLSTLTPVITGNMPNVSITNRVQNDNFAYLWEGFINIPVSGTYYFRTASDDGSRLWLGGLNESSSPYSFSGTPIVNNDGLHGTQSVTSAAQNLTAGTYPIAIAFYEQGGGESMSVTWRTPSTGTSYVSIPNSAFAQTVPPAGAVPDAPSLFSATAVSAKKINLAWQDNSSDETGFEIYRSTSPTSGFSIVGTTAANVTNFSDSTLAPETKYFYKLQAINLNGASTLIPVFDGYQARWQFNNDYSDASGNNKVISGSNGPTFNTDKQEGSHSINLDGSNDYINVNSSSGDFLRGGYSAKTVAFWMKADQTNSNRGIFDFGGSDDGLAMRVNSNQLYAGVASNNTRRSISVPYTSTAWNHIALVYNVNELRLFINGVSVAANTNLGFNSVTVTSNGSRIGDDNSSNALNTSFGVFDGQFDDFMVIGSALTATEINQIISQTYGVVTATTLSLPALPASPSNLVGTVQGASQVNLSWTNNASIASVNEVWRSPITSSNYELAATVNGNINSFDDNGLIPATLYYYKVRTINEAGISDYSNEISLTTGANPQTVVTLNTISDVQMVNDSTASIQIIANSDLGTSITYSASGLPSFATLNTNSNNTATLTLAPGSIDLGVYNVSLTATDNYGGLASQSFNINIAGRNQVIINVNLNQTLPQASPWNNMNGAPSAGLTRSGFVNQNGNATSIGLTLVNAWVGAKSDGVTTGNNSGVFLDNVMKTLYFGSNNTPHVVRLTGLSQSKRYSIKFFGGYPWSPAQNSQYGGLVTNYTIGAETVTLDAANNTSQFVQMNGVSCDASGNVQISITKAVGSGFVILNAIQIISYDVSATLSAPYNLIANGESTSSIKLNWQANSDIRTGFEIWRSTSPNGTYSLVGTVSGDVYSYSNNGLTAGKTYFYKVRAVNNAVSSSYSNVAGGSTVSYVVNLNFNSDPSTAAPAPAWNNLNTLLYDGYTQGDLYNTSGQNTGIGLEVIDNLSGYHGGVGVNTGNNSGVVPDIVMQTLYYIDYGDSSTFTITGLNQTQIYNFEFFGGTIYNVATNTVYTANGEIGSLNALFNTTNISRLKNLKPDASGTISVTLYPTTGYGFINSLSIQGMISPEIIALDSANANGNNNQNGRMIYVSAPVESENAGVIATTSVVPDNKQQTSAAEVTPEFLGDVQAYPNPFTDRINLRFNFKQDVPKFSIILTDMSGKQVLKNEFGKVYSGVWQQTVELNKKLPVGMYLLHIIGLPDGKPKVLKLLKTTSF